MGLDIRQPDLDFRNAVRIRGRFRLSQQGFPFLVARHNRVEQAFWPARCLLRHRADAGIFRHACRTRLGNEFAENKLQKRGFTGAVAPHKADLMAIRQGGRSFLQQEPSADSKGEIVDL
jgi:hypothetical protein